MMGERRDITRALQGSRDPGVHPGGPQPGDVGDQRVPDERVNEPDAPGPGLVEQSGDDARVQRVQHAVLVGVGGLHEHAHRAFPPGHRRQPQDGHAALGEPCQPTPQHVPYALRDLGERDQRALAGQQPRALPHIERVAAGPLGDAGHSRVVGLALGAYELRDRGAFQPGQVQPQRRGAGKGPERLCEALALLRAVCRDDEDRGPRADAAAEQFQRDGVRPVEVVQDDGNRPVGGRRREPVPYGLPQPEPPCRRVSVHRRGVGEQRRQVIRELAQRNAHGDLPQRLDPRPRGRRAIQFGTAPSGNQPPVLPESGAEVLQQRRLAEPRLSRDERDARPIGDGLPSGGHQRRKLALPTHERCPAGLVVRRWQRGGLGPRRVCGGRRDGRAEHVRALGEDRLFQGHQVRAGVEAQLVSERGAGAAERGQGVGLAAATPQREGVQAPALLAHGMVAGEELRLGYHRRGVAEPQSSRNVQFAGDQAQLIQPGGLGGGPRLVGDLGERGSPPQGQRLVQPGAGITGIGERTSLVEQFLEPPCVHRPRRQPQCVAGRRAHQQASRGPRRAAGFQQAAQVRYVRLQRRQGAGRRFAAPQVLDHPVDRHDLPARRHQQGQHAALPRSAEGNGHAAGLGRERAQHPYQDHDVAQRNAAASSVPSQLQVPSKPPGAVLSTSSR